MREIARNDYPPQCVVSRFIPKVTDLNRFAITSKGIGDALQRSASALSAAGNTIDESIGLITAANTVVQDPESVGTALKTLTLRLRGAKTELEEAGLETENMAETTASLQQKLLALTGGKVDIMIDANTFKSSTQILREMSTAWKDMTDIQKASALELMGGKRQANILSSIIDNFDIVEDAITTSMNSAGSAIEENEKYLDSINGKIQQFTNAVQTMWNDELSSEPIKKVVDFGTGLIKVVDTLGLIPSILAAIAAYKIVPSLLMATTHTKSLAEAMKLLVFGTQYANMSIGEIILSLKTLLPTIGANIASAATAIPTFTKIGYAVGGFKGAIVGVTEGLKGLWAAIPGVGQIMLIVAAIAAVVAIVDACTTSTKELEKKLNELKSELQEIQSELDSLNSELETTKSRMEELLAMDTLSFTEAEELKNLQKQNDELEREIYLLEQRQKRKQKEAEETFVKTVGGDLESHVDIGGHKTNMTTKDSIDNMMQAYQSAQEDVRAAEDALIQAEKDLENAKTEKEKKKAQKEVNKAEKEYEKKKKEADSYYNYVNDKIEEYTEYADGIDYDLADEDTKEILDYIYNLEDKIDIINGGDKSYAIKRIFNKEEFDNLKTSLEDLQKQLMENPEDENIISEITQKIEQSGVQDDLHAVGLEIKDAIGYWTMLGSQEDVNLEVEVDYEKLSDAIDSIQDAYSALTDAVSQYNKTGYLTLDSLQALLSLEPEYLALLQMENGQLSINQSAMEAMLQTKLEEAKITILDNGIKQLNALSTQAQAEATDGSTTAMSNAIPVLGTYASQLSAVGQEALIAAGKLSVLEEAAGGAVAAGVDPAKVKAVIDGMNASFAMLDATKMSLGSNFKSIVDPDKSSSSDKDEAFQKAMDYWENRIGANQARYEQIQNEIDLLEKQGKTAGKEYYEEQIRLENERLWLLEQQKAEAQKFLGTFREGSEEWWSVAETLNSLEGEIDDVTSAIQDLSDAIAEVDWYIFDEAHERYSTLIDDLDTIRDLISPNGEEDWFDDEGMWTDKGVASLATYIQQLEMYGNTYDEVTKKLNEDYSLPYAGNEEYYKNLGIDSEQELYDIREKLMDQQQEALKGASDSQQSIVDMYESQIDAVEEWANEAVEAYNDYIDVVKEALDAERDLYEFKKDVQKQTKDIASLERRIASLSGSTNAADIAERRKLEAELYEAREGLNDTYYDHTKDAQQQALDDEATAYEKSMNKFIEGLRKGLESALLNMDLFMQGVFSAVTANAPAILEQFNALGLSLDGAIIDPWQEAANAIVEFGGVDGLGMMNAWIAEGGIFPTFKSEATTSLTSPWTAGQNAANTFKTSVFDSMSQVVSNITSNVATAKSQLSSLYSQIQDTNTRLSSVNSSGGNTGGGGYDPDVAALQTVLNGAFGQRLEVDGKFGPATKNALITIQNALKMKGLNVNTDGKYTAQTKKAMEQNIDSMVAYARQSGSSSVIGQGIQQYLKYKNMLPTTFFAKGTLGTKRDELAITDESWIGEEITLAAGKNGQLQYLKKGSAVMPADISANLVEWGKLNPNMMKAGIGTNFNMINNAVNKPELNMSFDSLVHVDHCDEGTLKDLEKMVDTKINQFGKQLNYAIKKIGGR